jgi:hypothetical protein
MEVTRGSCSVFNSLMSRDEESSLGPGDCSTRHTSRRSVSGRMDPIIMLPEIACMHTQSLVAMHERAS